MDDENLNQTGESGGASTGDTEPEPEPEPEPETVYTEIGQFRQVFELEMRSTNGTGTPRKVLLRSFHLNELTDVSDSSAMLREITGRTVLAKPDGNFDFRCYLSEVSSISICLNVRIFYTVGD